MTHTVAVVGVGPDPEESSGESFSMGYRHAHAYEALESCELLACADLVSEHATAFADTFGIDADGVFEDHAAMLRAVDPDIVSVCVPPAAHAPLVIDCANAGVSAIHCEKPMADTWAKSTLMARTCWRRGVQLTFDHQLRFHDAVKKVKDLLDASEIGDLERVELSRSTLFDAGTHQIDLANYFAGDAAPEWVLGQVDYREENRLFGTHNANQALAQWEYENGVHGLAATGFGADLVGCSNRLVGSAGRIELDFADPERTVRIERPESAETFGFEGGAPLERGVEHVVESLESGTEPCVSARKALDATELIFGAFESARKRGRVEFPLAVRDNPLETMVADGALGVEPDNDPSDGHA